MNKVADNEHEINRVQIENIVQDIEIAVVVPVAAMATVSVMVRI